MYCLRLSGGALKLVVFVYIVLLELCMPTFFATIANMGIFLLFVVYSNT